MDAASLLREFYFLIEIVFLFTAQVQRQLLYLDARNLCLGGLDLRGL